jgi:regulatory protein
MESRHTERRVPRAPRPLDPARLEEIAIAYVARFATSAGKLSAYLKRKLRERGWDADQPPDVAAVVARMVGFGYVDDAVYARSKGQGLLSRGYGARRIDQALNAAGIAEPLRDEARGTGSERRAAALAFARKRRMGPFGRGSGEDGDQRLDPATREKQVAAFLRAGHPLASARAMVNAVSITQAEEWADEELD